MFKNVFVDTAAAAAAAAIDLQVLWQAAYVPCLFLVLYGQLDTAQTLSYSGGASVCRSASCYSDQSNTAVCYRHKYVFPSL